MRGIFERGNNPTGGTGCPIRDIHTHTCTCMLKTQGSREMFMATSKRVSLHRYGSGSKIGTPNGTLVNGNMD